MFTRQLVKSGIEFVFNHEGSVPYLYLDPTNFLTIGIGHLCIDGEYFLKGKSVKELTAYGISTGKNIKITNILHDGSKKAFFVKIGKGWDSEYRITNEEIEFILSQDLRRFCNGVDKFVNIPLTDNQFSACVSLAYNIGIGRIGGTRGFLGSSLFKHLNAGRFEMIRPSFNKFVFSAGQKLPGLVKRRSDEADLFFTPDGYETEKPEIKKAAQIAFESYLTKKSV